MLNFGGGQCFTEKNSTFKRQPIWASLFGKAKWIDTFLFQLLDTESAIHHFSSQKQVPNPDAQCMAFTFETTQM